MMLKGWGTLELKMLLMRVWIKNLFRATTSACLACSLVLSVVVDGKWGT